MNVVSFDGVDSLGKPYDVNDVLAKGFADKLTSQPIRMDLVSPGIRNTVYISFFYQLQGHGEPPDPGDQLILSLKDNAGVWTNFYVIETNASMATDTFTQVILPIIDDKYFHDNFQFRFTNFARLSGPYDTWNVDYIYLNSGRSTTDIYYPDRTISSAMSSLLKDYYAMPVRHFLEDISGNLVQPTLELYNLKLFNADLGPHVQPINYTTSARIDSRVNGVVGTSTVGLDTTFPTPTDLPGLTFMPVTLNTIPQPADFDPAADSIHITLRYGMTTSDNKPPSLLGDYDSAKYYPIDFRYSDSLTANFTLASYYAYDDGTAEYAAGLNQAGSYLAFLFDMKTLNPDTLTYVDIYFPEFGDNTSQSLLLQIRTILGDINSVPLFEQLIVVERKTMNTFARYPLYKPVPVAGPFYLGWKQLTNVPIPVGLDKNTDNGNKIYYSISGDWIQNTLVKGSIMVRPGFGRGDGSVVTGLETAQTVKPIYPNPTSGTCTLRGHAESLVAYDITGRQQSLTVETIGPDTQITFSSGTSGLVLVRYVIEGKAYAQKLMVR